MEGVSPTEQVSQFEDLVKTKLDQFCPEKVVRLSSQDKPFITADMKKVKRQKSREYVKNGKTQKYHELSAKFKALYQSEAKKYLDKKLDALRSTNPGQAYHILKQMGHNQVIVLTLTPSHFPVMKARTCQNKSQLNKLPITLQLLGKNFPH